MKFSSRSLLNENSVSKCVCVFIISNCTKAPVLSYMRTAGRFHIIRSTESNSQCGFETRCTLHTIKTLKKSNSHIIHTHFIIFMPSDLICTADFPYTHIQLLLSHLYSSLLLCPLPTVQLKSGADTSTNNWDCVFLLLLLLSL